VIQKEAKKIQKYKDFIRENRRMWNVKAKVIPVIVEVTGTISKSFRQYLRNTPGRQENLENTDNSRIRYSTHYAGSTNVKVRNIFHYIPYLDEK
jgi:hypothetical protein